MLTKVSGRRNRGVSVEEVFNSYNLGESPRPPSNIKAHVWSPQQLPGEKSYSTPMKYPKNGANLAGGHLIQNIIVNTNIILGISGD